MNKPAREHWKEIEDQVHHKVVQQGLYSAAFWGTGAITGHLLLTKFNSRYRKHTFPFKLFVLLMVPTAAFFTTTDVAAMEEDRKFALQYSLSKPDPIQSAAMDLKEANWKQYLRDNQFSLVGYTWLALVGSTLAYNFAKPQITLQQKFINARMVSQAGALLGIVAVAALSLKRQEKVQGRVENDAHFERVVGGKN